MNKTLFIVEGNVTEPIFLEKAIEILDIDKKHKIYKFSTNIEKLNKEIKELSGDFEIIEVLKGFEQKKLSKAMVNGDKEGIKEIKEKLEILEEDFQEKFLVFDREPHIEEQTIEMLVELQSYFFDQYDNGFLIISYPMFESIKDINSLVLNEFLTYTTSINEFNSYLYKTKVTNVRLKEGEVHLNAMHKWSLDVLKIILFFHFEKIMFLENLTIDQFYKMDNLEEFGKKL